MFLFWKWNIKNHQGELDPDQSGQCLPACGVTSAGVPACRLLYVLSGSGLSPETEWGDTGATVQYWTVVHVVPTEGDNFDIADKRYSFNILKWWHYLDTCLLFSQDTRHKCRTLRQQCGCPSLCFFGSFWHWEPHSCPTIHSHWVQGQHKYIHV